MSKKFTSEQLNELVSALQGTCDELNSAINELFGDDYSDDDLTEDDHNFIDNEIFHCDDCGWWYEVVEQSEVEDEKVCNDCNECR